MRFHIFMDNVVIIFVMFVLINVAIINFFNNSRLTRLVGKTYFFLGITILKNFTLTCRFKETCEIHISHSRKIMHHRNNRRCFLNYRKYYNIAMPAKLGNVKLVPYHVIKILTRDIPEHLLIINNPAYGNHFATPDSLDA